MNRALLFTWPDGDKHDFIVPAEEENYPVALHNIRLENDLIFLDLGPN